MRVKFARTDGFYQELKTLVEEYFTLTGLSQRDSPRMYVKSAVLVAWMGASYALLVFAATTWWQALPLAISLGLAMAGIGFNLQHDGGHGAFSRAGWVNQVMAWMLDVLGGSSYVWHWKHNVFLHTYPNVAGADDDINSEPFLRLSPNQPRYWAHRFQHLYVWALYGLLPMRWQAYDDFKNVATARIASNHFPRPRGWRLFALLGGKALFVSWALVLPLLLYPWWVVLPFFIVTSFTLGVTLSVIFQLAHCVGEAEFPTFAAGEVQSEHEWAVHQVRTTVDFAPSNRLLSWYIGGLNFQIEHHLFPRIAHVHYPALARIVQGVCARFGVPYHVHRGFWGALGAHQSWLRRLGRPALDSEKKG
jgi:linoleoyl-CoA desaturase